METIFFIPTISLLKFVKLLIEYHVLYLISLYLVNTFYELKKNEHLPSSFLSIKIYVGKMASSPLFIGFHKIFKKNKYS
jgi:hypothetical protein